MKCPRCNVEVSILARDIATGLCRECLEIRRQELEAVAAQRQIEREEAERLEERERKAKLARWRKMQAEKGEAAIARIVTPCIKCGESKRVESLPITDSESYSIEIPIDEMPSASVFKDRTQHKLTASVCGHCGYTELYLDSPKKFWQSFTTSVVNSLPRDE